jgi:hypothetical protein
LADWGEHIRISSEVRTREAVKVLLVNGDDPIYLLTAINAVMLTWNVAGSIQPLTKSTVEGIKYQLCSV